MNPLKDTPAAPMSNPQPTPDNTWVLKAINELSNTTSAIAQSQKNIETSLDKIDRRLDKIDTKMETTNNRLSNVESKIKYAGIGFGVALSVLVYFGDKAITFAMDMAKIQQEAQIKSETQVPAHNNTASQKK